MSRQYSASQQPAPATECHPAAPIDGPQAGAFGNDEVIDLEDTADNADQDMGGSAQTLDGHSQPLEGLANSHSADPPEAHKPPDEPAIDLGSAGGRSESGRGDLEESKSQEPHSSLSLPHGMAVEGFSRRAQQLNAQAAKPTATQSQPQQSQLEPIDIDLEDKGQDKQEKSQTLPTTPYLQPSMVRNAVISQPLTAKADGKIEPTKSSPQSASWSPNWIAEQLRLIQQATQRVVNQVDEIEPLHQLPTAPLKMLSKAEVTFMFPSLSPVEWP